MANPRGLGARCIQDDLATCRICQDGKPIAGRRRFAVSPSAFLFLFWGLGVERFSRRCEKLWRCSPGCGPHCCGAIPEALQEKRAALPQKAPREAAFFSRPPGKTLGDVVGFSGPGWVFDVGHLFVSWGQEHVGNEGALETSVGHAQPMHL